MTNNEMVNLSWMMLGLIWSNVNAGRESRLQLQVAYNRSFKLMHEAFVRMENVSDGLKASVTVPDDEDMWTFGRQVSLHTAVRPCPPIDNGIFIQRRR